MKNIKEEIELKSCNKLKVYIFNQQMSPDQIITIVDRETDQVILSTEYSDNRDQYFDVMSLLHLRNYLKFGNPKLKSEWTKGNKRYLVYEDMVLIQDIKDGKPIATRIVSLND